MAQVTQLGYVGLGVSDVGAWEPFATEILGLQLGERLADGALLLRMDDNHYRLAVHLGGDDGLAYQGWQVADEHALTAMIDQFRTAGAAINVGTAEGAAARHERGLIRFQDPEASSTKSSTDRGPTTISRSCRRAASPASLPASRDWGTPTSSRGTSSAACGAIATCWGCA